MKNKTTYDNIFMKIFTVLTVLWISKTFLTSIPYKFTWHEFTTHIFTTIWEWISLTINSWLGILFWKYAAYVIWSFEIVASILLLIPTVIIIIKSFGWLKNKEIPNYLLSLGWLLSFWLMSWAIFFHLITPLWINVLWDWGSLFMAAVSVCILGFSLFIIYFNWIISKFVAK